MLKTLDVLIGLTTVLLLFSMAVTVMTQVITNLAARRGRHLKAGLSSLLQQLGIPSRDLANEIAKTVLKHPLIANGRRLGTVIHREEFIRLLLDLASGVGASQLQEDSRNALQGVLKQGGIPDPEQRLKNIRALSLQLQASNPELSNHLRDGLAIVNEASSDFVARVNSWFDQTIDRVSQRFTSYTHGITIGVAVVVVVLFQLDILAVTNRLFMEEATRNAIMAEANRLAQAPNPNTDPRASLELLSNARLISPPSLAVLKDWAKLSPEIPGMALAVLLISLGAPFWYNVLKNLLRLRSTLAAKDDAQREQRQTSELPESTAPGPSRAAVMEPAWLAGERGDLAAVG